MNDKKMPSDADYPWIKSYPADVDWNMEIPSIPIYDMLDKTAAAYPDAPGFDFLGAKMSWGEINDLTRKFAKGLQEIGVSKGAKVGSPL